ncbi:glycosyltransferase family 4 protein [Thalassospira sp. MA62]|nr:glycosyltransferase family 4 protein [Thalassospira sp. MA62]
MDQNLATAPRHRDAPTVWMIGRVDQFTLLAEYLAAQNRLQRWDSFWRHDGTGVLRPPARRVDPNLNHIPGRHLAPDLLGRAARSLRLPAHNLYSDIPLSILATRKPPKADILHGQGNYSLPAMRCAKRRGLITISDVTGQLAPIRAEQLGDEYRAYGQTYGEISRHLARRRIHEAQIADAVFAPSETVIDGLERCGIARHKIHLVPFIAPRCVPLIKCDRAYRTNGTSSNPIRFLFVGNLSLAKGLGPLLQAWRGLYQTYGRRIRLTLVGSLSPCARQLIADLPDGCDWVGKLSGDQIAQRMLDADMFIFPTLSEGSSLAVMEAMAAGCAVITTFDAGSPVTHGKSGMIVPPRNANALQHAASHLIAHPDLCQEIGRTARLQIKRALETGYANRVDQAYDKVLSAHG